jgi:hypothetical protein
MPELFHRLPRNVFTIFSGRNLLWHALAEGKFSATEQVNLFGHNGALEFKQDETGLKVRMAAEKPCDYAFSLEIVPKPGNSEPKM